MGMLQMHLTLVEIEQCCAVNALMRATDLRR